MKSWGKIFEEDVGGIFKHVGGFFSQVGHAFVGGGAASGKAIGGLAGAVNWVAKVAAIVPLKIAKGVARIANTRPVGYIGAAIAVVGATIAGVIGVKSWHDGRHARAERRAMEQSETAVALAQNNAEKEARAAELNQQRAAAVACIADKNAPANHVAKLETDQTQTVVHLSV